MAVRGGGSTPSGVRSRLVHASDNTNALNFQRWAIEDLNGTPYAETRLFKAKPVLHIARPQPARAYREGAADVLQPAGGGLSLLAIVSVRRRRGPSDSAGFAGDMAENRRNSATWLINHSI